MPEEKKAAAKAGAAAAAKAAKATEPKAEPKKAAPKKPAAKKPRKKAAPKFVSVRVQQYHPFQKVYIPMGSPGVMLEEDSWVNSQIKRGLIKKL